MLLDTNVLVRHLTGQPPGQARRATAFLRGAERLLVADLIIAELVYVLESVYERPRPEVAALVRAVLAFGPVETADESLLLRAVEPPRAGGASTFEDVGGLGLNDPRCCGQPCFG